MQSERALLSARGEGGFRCRGVKSEGASTELTVDANRRVAEDGVVHLRCLFLHLRPRAYYSTPVRCLAPTLLPDVVRRAEA